MLHGPPKNHCGPLLGHGPQVENPCSNPISLEADVVWIFIGSRDFKKPCANTHNLVEITSIRENMQTCRSLFFE